MAYNATRRGRIELAPQSTWGTAATTGYLQLDAEWAAPPVVREMLERQATKSGWYALAPIEGSQAGGELSLKWDVHGWTAGAVAADPTDIVEYLVLKSLLGAGLTGGYAAGAVSGGSTSTAVKIDNAVPSSTYDPGMAVGLRSGSTYTVGWIREVVDGGASDHTLDLLADCGLTPDSGSDTYGAMVAALGTGESSLFTIRMQGADSNSRLTLLNCVPKSCKITLSPKGKLEMEVGFWVHSAQSTPGALGPDDALPPTLPAALGRNAAGLYLDSPTGTTRTALAVQSLELSIEQELAEALDYTDAEGVAAVVTTDRKVRIEGVALVAGTAPTLSIPGDQRLVFQVGTVPGRMLSILIPQGHHAEVGELSDAEGLWGQKFSVIPGAYAGDVGSSAVAQTPFRIAWL